MASLPPRADYYRVLYDVAKSVNSSLSLPQVLVLIAESTAKAMGTKACSVRLLDPMREQLEISAEYGLSPSYILKGPVKVSKSPIDAEVLEGRTVQIYEAGGDPRLQYPEEVAREGIASILAVPVCVRDVVIGVMRVYTAEPREFSADEVEFLTAVANLGGIAIENARLYQTLEAEFQAIRREKIPWAENWNKPRWR